MVKPTSCNLIIVLVTLLVVDTVRCYEQTCPICPNGSLSFDRTRVINFLFSDEARKKLQTQFGKSEITCGDMSKTAGSEIIECGVEKYAYACGCSDATNNCGELEDMCDDESLFDKGAIFADKLTCEELDLVADFADDTCKLVKGDMADQVKKRCCVGKSLRQTITDIDRIDCSICSGNETMEFDEMLLGVEGLTCSDVETIGSFSEDVCDELRDNFDFVCGCPGEEKPPCTACPDGMSVFDLTATLLEVDDVTIKCAKAEELALIRCFEDDFDNQALHDLVSERCGCGGPPPVSPPSSETTAESKISDGTIVGIIIAVAFVGFGCFGAAYWWSRKQISK